METIIKQQAAAAEKIAKSFSNFKKDGPSRRTQSYLNARLQRLEYEWSEFEKRDIQLQAYRTEKPDSSYFEKGYYMQVEAVYEEYKTAIVQAQTDLEKTKTTSTSSDRSENANSVQRLIRQQKASVKALEHLLETTESSLKDHTARYCNHRLTAIKEQWSAISARHLEIVAEEDTYDYPADDIYELEERCRTVLDKLEDHLVKWQPAPEAATVDSSHHGYNKLKLPKITLPVFSGNYLQWKEFHDLYLQLIHQQAISAAEKMFYLKANLSGEAAKLIQHLQVSEENYASAWTTLEHRYNNKRLLLSALLNKLLGQPAVTGDSSTTVKRLHDTTNECLLAIRNLGIPIADWDPLLIHLILPKIDRETHRLYEQSLDKPRELQTIQGLLSFLESRFQMLEALGTKEKNESKRPNRVVLTTATEAKGCSICNQHNHAIFKCPSFLQLSVTDRLKRVKLLKRCINCLRFGHQVSNCKSGHCTKCNKFHHTLLHITEFQPNSEAQVLKFDNRTSLSTFNTNNASSNYVLLGTAIVNILSRTSYPIKTRALLDSGSQMSFITDRLAKQLKLTPKQEMLEVSGMGDTRVKINKKVNVCLQSRVNGFSTNLEVYVLNTITSRQPSQFINTAHWNIPKNIQLADSTFNQPQDIDLLIGAELFPDLISVGQIKIQKNLPTLQNTLLGWIVIGKTTVQVSSSLFCGISTESALDTILQKFWMLDEVPPTTSKIYQQLTVDERRCEEIFEKTTTRTETGRYVVTLPFANSPKSLGESKEIAIRRFLSLEKRLQRNPELQRQYADFMREYIALKHMTEVDDSELIKKPHYFLPHHGVLRPESSSTKLRVVFDGSANTSTNISLNDILHTGPALQNNLFSILLRFRTHRYVFTADISKMYRQIQVDDNSKQFQLVIWRESTNLPLKVYQLNTVTYGTKSAPYLAIRCLRDLSQAADEQHSLGATICQRDIYMDDILTGSNNLQETLEMQTELISLLKEGQFYLRKWCANAPELLAKIPKEDREVENILHAQNEGFIKTLGITWLPSSDQFIIRTKWKDLTKVTKRSILADIAHIFDPLGLLSPVIILAKIFIQELWLLKIDWDAALPMEMHTKWTHFRKELLQLDNLKIPRHIVLSNATKIELHAFSDASQRAYGAAVYLRSANKQGKINVQLVCSKSRVAPTKQQTIPRLELCAAKLMVQLIKVVTDSLTIEIEKINYWTDSQIVLSWIFTQSPLQTFVANRVSFIQEETTKGQWKFINSEVNPADLLSRGIFPEQLLNSTAWFKGPEFLRNPKIPWPTQPAMINDINVPEIKRMKTVLTAVKPKPHFLEDINHRNSFHTLQRITAYIIRFISNLKRARKYRLLDKVLSVQELKAANTIIFQYVQQITFSDDITTLKKTGQVSDKSRLSPVSPFMDDRNLIRVGGRLQASELPYEAKHQIILPSSHSFTKMLMTQLHQQNLHAGPQALLAIARQQYWILRGKQLAQTTVHNCIRCFKAKPRSIEQLMGNLPPERVQPCRPFINVGIDFLGPVHIHYTIRGKKPTKAYVSVFICFATKAIHLELVSDLTTEAFIGALKRFTARRGCPAKIFSDNATNFIGARNALEALSAKTFNDDGQTLIRNHCARQGIDWKTIPARSPHFGGLWEAAVKSAKHHMRRILSSALLTHEELVTALAQIEAVLNSRPLTPISTNPNDLEALTPGHFLTGAPLTTVVDPDCKAMNISNLARWNLVTSIQREFWRRWTSEYLQEIQTRYKWKHPLEDVQPGMLVLIKEDNLPPLKWQMGRILEIIPGKDKLTRVVNIKTAKGEIRRSICKICPLPMESQQDVITPEPSKLQRIPEKRKSNHPLKGMFYPIQQPASNITIATDSQNAKKRKGPENSSEGRKLKINSLSSLFLGLLIIGTTFGPVNCRNPVEVQEFKDNPGIYFEDLGQVNLITDEWNLFVYFNMSSYWDEYQGLKESVEGLRQKCEALKKHPHHFCEAIIKHLDHRLRESESLNEILKHRNGMNIRSKRSPFDFIGTISNKLFGILDQDYAQHIESHIQQANSNEEHLLQLNKNQTSIIESTANVLHKSIASINEQFKLINHQLTRVYNAVEDLSQTEVFNHVAIYIFQLMDSFQRSQRAVMEAITDTHQGRISSLLLSPKQLIKELDNIRKHIPPTLTLPEYDGHNLPKVYELLRVKTRVTSSNIIFLVKLPLLSSQMFQIFKLIPLPVHHNDSFTFIQPSTAFLAISPYRDQFFPLSQEEILRCLQIEQQKYLCKQRHPIFNTHSTKHQCEINMLSHKTQLSPLCVLQTSKPEKIWIQLHNPNQWIFAFRHEEVFSIVCGSDILSTKLKDVGLLKLAPNCVIKQPTMTINAHNFYVSKSAMSFVPALNLSQMNSQITGKINEDNNFLIRGDEDLTVIQKKITDLKPQQTLPGSITHHDVHQYSIAYLSLVAVLLLIITLYLRRRNQPTPQASKDEEFELQDLKVGEDV